METNMKSKDKKDMDYLTGAHFNSTPLFPCHIDSEFYLKGYTEFGDYLPMEIKNQFVVAVWDKNHDWEFFYDDVIEYLLVEVEYLNKKSTNPEMPYLHKATVIKKIPSNEVTIFPVEVGATVSAGDTAFIKSNRS